MKKYFFKIYLIKKNFTFLRFRKVKYVFQNVVKYEIWYEITKISWFYTEFENMHIHLFFIERSVLER